MVDRSQRKELGRGEDAAQGSPDRVREGRPDRGGDGGEDGPALLVVRGDGDGGDGEEVVAQPAKLLRIAAMTHRMLHEVREIELDEASRRRLAQIYNASLDELCGVLSDDLRDELSNVAFAPLESDHPPSKAELQVAQAQLAGWLEGLFQGIQASIASQQFAAQQQLSQLRARHALGSGKAQPDDPGTGHYL